MGFRNLFALAALVVVNADFLAVTNKCNKCPAGYTFHPLSGKCFKLYRMPKGQPAGWSNYRRACQSLPPKEWRIRAADLASIHGTFDQGIALELAKPLKEGSVWIGLHQVGPAWKWTDDSKFGGSPFWAPGMPDGLPKQDCVRLTLPQGLWDDIQCGAQAISGAICQVVAACKRPHVATPKPTPKRTTPKPTPKRTKAPRRTTVRRRPTPKATRRPPPPTRRATPKPTSKRTQPPRRTTSRRRPTPIATRRPPKTTTSPKVKSSKKPEEPKPTTSKPRDCPCRKHKSTSHPPKQPKVTTVPTKKPDDAKESTEKPHDCGEPPKKPEDP